MKLKKTILRNRSGKRPLKRPGLSITIKPTESEDYMSVLSISHAT